MVCQADLRMMHACMHTNRHNYVFPEYPVLSYPFFYSLPEFASLVESVLENTLLNVLKEANSGELNITSPIYTIAKPLPTDTVQ